MRNSKREVKGSNIFGFVVREHEQIKLQKLHDKKVNFEKMKKRWDINTDDVVDQILNMIK